MTDKKQSLWVPFWSFVQNKVVPSVIIGAVPLAFGYAVRFEKTVDKVEKGETERTQIKKMVESVEEKHKLVAWMMCEDAIRKNKEEAIKRCRKVLGEEL